MNAKQGTQERTGPYRPQDTDERGLLTRAQEGDKAAVPGMRKVLDEVSEGYSGKIPSGLTMQNKLIESFAERLTRGGDLLYRECIIREAEQVRAAAAGPNPTPLESLLADRAALSFLHVQYTEVMYQSALIAGGTCNDMRQYADRIDVANRRYLAAIKTLAQALRLQIPTLQIAMAGATQSNIGDKQVNMAGQLSQSYARGYAMNAEQSSR